MRTISETTYQSLRAMIISGELAPGDRLIQRTLGARLGVSSIPIIEATRRLERDGLVQSLPNCGARVRVWSDQDLEDAYRLREAHEALACRLFVQRAGLRQKERLQELERKFREAVFRGDANGWLQADLALHGHIAESCLSLPLQLMLDTGSVLALTLGNAFRRQRLRNIPELIPEAGAHEELVRVLLTGTPEEAEEVGGRLVREAYLRLVSAENPAVPA